MLGELSATKWLHAGSPFRQTTVLFDDKYLVTIVEERYLGNITESRLLPAAEYCYSCFQCISTCRHALIVLSTLVVG